MTLFKISKACFSLIYFFKSFEQKYLKQWKITKFSVRKSMNIHRILQFGSKYVIPHRLRRCKKNVPKKIEFTSFFCSHSQKSFKKFNLEHVFHTFVVCLAYEYWCQNPGWVWYLWIPKKEMINVTYFYFAINITYFSLVQILSFAVNAWTTLVVHTTLEVNLYLNWFLTKLC